MEDESFGFKVRDCQLRRPDGSTFVWNPTAQTPPAPVLKKGPYIDQNIDGTGPERCMIPVQGGCRRDDRTDMKRSTQAAMVALREAWDDDVLAGSGSAVVATVLSHNGGYDDSRFGVRKSINLLPAVTRWRDSQPETEWHTFYGQNIKCPTKQSPNNCRSLLFPETQHYGYTILAQHMLAICYYGKNYRDQHEAFRSWDNLMAGYCDRFAIPTSAEVRNF